MKGVSKILLIVASILLENVYSDSACEYVKRFQLNQKCIDRFGLNPPPDDQEIQGALAALCLVEACIVKDIATLGSLTGIEQDTPYCGKQMT
ncbi:UNVERIFIED_CONTAM: hypothetical protein RMT77_019829 [Armadillidium vulgare]